MGQVTELGEWLLRQHGPLLGGSDLTRALGFRTVVALKKARRSGHLHLNIFHIAGRRGPFCLTTDVAAWLEQVANVAEEAEPPTARNTEGIRR